MLNQIFNPTNFFFRGCNKILDVLLLSLLWVACCLPVVTIGPATAALYYAVVKCLRRGEENPYQNFLRCFKNNLKVGVLTTVVAGIAWILLWWGQIAVRVMALGGNPVAEVLSVSYQVLGVLLMGVTCWLFPVLSRFTFGVWALIAASCKLALKHLPSTVVVALLTLEVIRFCAQFWAPVVLAPALTILLTSLFMERIFKKYTPTPGGEEKPWYLQ